MIDPYNALLAFATNIPVRLETGFVIWFCIYYVYLCTYQCCQLIIILAITVLTVVNSLVARGRHFGFRISEGVLRHFRFLITPGAGRRRKPKCIFYSCLQNQLSLKILLRSILLSHKPMAIKCTDAQSDYPMMKC